MRMLRLSRRPCHFKLGDMVEANKGKVFIDALGSFQEIKDKLFLILEKIEKLDTSKG